MRTCALLITVAVIAATAVGALAYWRGGGSGAGMTALPNLQQLSLSRGIPSAQLSPGGNASVSLVVGNPNDYFVHIPSLDLADVAEPFGVDAGHSGCAVSTLSFSDQDNGGAGWMIPPKVGTTNGTLAISMPSAMHMSVAAASACQGATFSVRLVASN